MTQAPRLAVLHDDAAVLARSLAYLRDIGCETSRPESSDALLALASDGGVDLVFCGRHTVSADDYALLARLIASGVPVVVITVGGEDISLLDRLLRLGAADLIAERYVDTEVASHLLRRNLAQTRLRRENREIQNQLKALNADLRRRLDELQRDEQAGRQIQLKMLPDTPQRHGSFEFAHRMYPSLYLSGDYVDYFTLGDHHAAFFIADVSGHGASSAFITVLLKHLSARARSALGRAGDRTILSPAAHMRNLNRELLATRLGKHITMFGGILNMKTSSLRYCVAGHLPLPVLLADGGTRYLPGTGLPVGLFEEATYEDLRIRLPERFTLMGFSDGVLELLPQKQLQDKEAALLQLVAAGDGTLGWIAGRLGIGEGRELPDDITLMRISRHD